MRIPFFKPEPEPAVKLPSQYDEASPTLEAYRRRREAWLRFGGRAPLRSQAEAGMLDPLIAPFKEK